MQTSDAQQMASAQPASSYSIQVFRYLCKNYFQDRRIRPCRHKAVCQLFCIRSCSLTMEPKEEKPISLRRAIHAFLWMKRPTFLCD